MKKYQDIKITDEELKTEFIQLFVAGQYAQAFNILTNNSQLNTKAFTTDVLNIIYNMLTTLENYYVVNVPDFLSITFQEYNLLIGNFLMKNEWNDAVEYQRYHFVIYNQQIYMYNNEIPSTGNLPTDTDYWLYLGLKGIKGSPSIGTVLRYNWDTAVNYVQKDVVIYGDVLYVALRNNTNKNPQSSPLDWQILFNVPKGKIIVSPTEPLDKYEGMIWWKIL